MKILVTGSSGFIGSHLVEQLSRNKKNTVYELSRSNRNSKNSVFLKCDFTTNEWLAKLPKKADVIVHLAQSREYRNFPEGSKDMYLVNIDSTFKLLEWAKNHGVKHFILASTGNVYRQKKTKLKEGDFCDPEGFYASSKFAAELLAIPYSNFFSVTILRMFGVYGPGQQNALIPNIISTIKSGRAISVGNDKGLYITPLFIKDCIDMLMKILVIKNNKKVSIYNLAGDEVVNLKEIGEIIGDKLGKPPKFKMIDQKTTYLIGSNNLFKEAFKYKKILTSFSKGIESCL